MRSCSPSWASNAASQRGSGWRPVAVARAASSVRGQRPAAAAATSASGVAPNRSSQCCDGMMPTIWVSSRVRSPADWPLPTGRVTPSRTSASDTAAGKRGVR